MKRVMAQCFLLFILLLTNCIGSHLRLPVKPGGAVNNCPIRIGPEKRKTVSISVVLNRGEGDDDILRRMYLNDVKDTVLASGYFSRIVAEGEYNLIIMFSGKFGYSRNLWNASIYALTLTLYPAVLEVDYTIKAILIDSRDEVTGFFSSEKKEYIKLHFTRMELLPRERVKGKTPLFYTIRNEDERPAKALYRIALKSMIQKIQCDIGKRIVDDERIQNKITPPAEGKIPKNN